MIRVARPEDFRVDEVPLYPPAGRGGHTFLRVEKRLRSTEELARALARIARVPARDVGYAGRKDRFALTTQWFSVPGLSPEAARGLELPDARVLEAAAHPHKLRTGQLRANRFEITLRGVAEETLRAAQRRLAALAATGMPNRYGGQRYGRDGGNALRGRRILAGELRLRDRRRARFLLSALQAEVFDAVLAAREPDLVTLERGDLAVVHASGGIFLVEDPERESPRAARFEISATGPIFGARMREPRGVPAERERAALEACGIPRELRPPPGISLRGARRPLRVRPAEARLEPLPGEPGAAAAGGSSERTGGGLRLRFTLPPGSYASVLLEEVLGGDIALRGAAERSEGRSDDSATASDVC